MRVLHVNTMDKHGGAARAAHRIHLAQRAAGIDSHMLVLHRSESDCFIHTASSKGGKIGQRLRQTVSARIMQHQIKPTNAVLHSLNLFDTGLADWINHSDFDIINLHWIGSELISIEEIGRIQKPICWTMHDMWPFCGAEHYDDLDHPERYVVGYRPDNRPSGYAGLDLDAWTWRRKKRAWARQTFHLISPSRWLAECAARSNLMQHQSCVVIPNCVDTNIFKPIDRRLARTLLNLDPDKRYILFGAVSSTSDKRKGFHLLQPALQRLAAQSGILKNTELLIFGSQAPLSPPDLGLPVHYLGTFSDEISLALLYSAADVFAAPSMQDNLPNTIVESICCGTACVAFSLGGMPDIIKSQTTGELANPFNVAIFSKLLENQLQNPINQETIRRSGLINYCQKEISASYIKIYQEIVRTENKQI